MSFTRVLRCCQYRISVVMKHTRLCSSSAVIISDHITRYVVTLCPRWDWQYGEEGWRKNNYLPLLLVGQLILCSNRRREGNYNLIKIYAIDYRIIIRRKAYYCRKAGRYHSIESVISNHIIYRQFIGK